MPFGANVQVSYKGYTVSWNVDRPDKLEDWKDSFNIALLKLCNFFEKHEGCSIAADVCAEYFDQSFRDD